MLKKQLEMCIRLDWRLLKPIKESTSFAQNFARIMRL